MIRIGVTLLFIGVAGYLGYVYIIRQKELLEATKLDIVNIKVKRLSFTDAELILVLRVVNKSGLKLTVTKQHYTAYINDTYIADIVNTEDVVLSPRSSISTEMLVTFNPLEFLGAGYKIVSNINLATLKLKIKGKLTVKSGLAAINNIPLEYEIGVDKIMNK